MQIGMVMALLQQALTVALMVIAPLLITTAVLGVLISVLQAVTQVSEQSLSFIPKVLGAGLVLFIMGSWMLSTLVTFVVHALDGSLVP